MLRQELLAEIAASTWDALLPFFSILAGFRPPRVSHGKYASQEVVGGGVDRECRGADWDDDSPGYFSVAHASSLARCQETSSWKIYADGVPGSVCVTGSDEASSVSSSRFSTRNAALS